MKVFGDKAFEKSGKGFISMHFSDQQPGTNKKILVFKFALPDENHMADMTRLVALVPYYIDLIGRYKLSSHVSTNIPNIVCVEYLSQCRLVRVYDSYVRLDQKQKQLERKLPRRCTENFRMRGKMLCRRRKRIRERSWRRLKRS